MIGISIDVNNCCFDDEKSYSYINLLQLGCTLNSIPTEQKDLVEIAFHDFLYNDITEIEKEHSSISMKQLLAQGIGFCASVMDSFFEIRAILEIDLGEDTVGFAKSFENAEKFKEMCDILRPIVSDKLSMGCLIPINSIIMAKNPQIASAVLYSERYMETLATLICCLLISDLNNVQIILSTLASRFEIMYQY